MRCAPPGLAALALLLALAPAAAAQGTPPAEAGAAPGAVAPDPVPEAPGTDVEAAPAPPRLEGTGLYLAQLMAQLGAEGLLAPFACCPATSGGVSLLAPALSVLAMDWVGRELGGVQGSQPAAMVTAYGLDCLGGLAVGFGYAAFYFPAYLGFLALAAGAPEGTTLLMMSLPGAALCGLGLCAVTSRPFVVPLVWSAFAPAAAETDEEERGGKRSAPVDTSDRAASPLATAVGVAF